MADSPPAFHMQDIGDNIPVLPKGVDISDEARPDDAQFVELGSIQTNPKIGV